MSSWLANPAGSLPYANNLPTVDKSFGYYPEQGAIVHQAPSVVPESFTTQRVSGLHSQQVAAPHHQPVPAPWQQHSYGSYAHAWGGQQPLAGDLSPITSPQGTTDSQMAAKLDEQSKKIQDLERELQLARSQLEQQQQDGRTFNFQIEGLKAELAAERQRADELGHQLHAEIAAHQTSKAELNRIITQHASLVREHEHMVSSQAATMRELEARHADVSRLQRQLEEAQAAALAAGAAAGANGATPGGPNAHSAAGGGHLCGGSSDSLHRVSPRGAHSSLSAAEEERWALRLHKAERALEEERRVSEDLRQQLVSAEAQERAATKRVLQLEVQLLEASRAAKTLGAAADGSPGHSGILPVNSDPLPRSPQASVPYDIGVSPMAGKPAAPTGWFGGSNGAGSGPAAGAPPGVPPGQMANPFLAAAVTDGDAGGASSPVPQPLRPEDQVARLKREVEVLRADLARLVAAKEEQRVTVRAAEDRARAAELVSLDVRRQCDQAARTIGRLIDENNELVAKVNAQAFALSDCKAAVAAKEAELRTVGTRLAEAQAQLASQEQALMQSPPPKQIDLASMQHRQYHAHQQSADEPAASSATDGSAGAPLWVLQHSQHHHQPNVEPSKALQQLPPPQKVAREAGVGNVAAAAREGLMPGNALTEADWKLVMLAEEVRRLVEEVSLAATARRALELKQHRPAAMGIRGPNGQGAFSAAAVTGATSPTAGSAAASVPKLIPGATPVPSSMSSSVSLQLILSRLDGLKGRRLSPGETAAYIIELAGHMEALEQDLHQEHQRMDELTAAQCPKPEAGPGPVTGAGDGALGGNWAADALEGPQAGFWAHSQAGQGQHLHCETHQHEQLGRGDQQQQQQQEQPHRQSQQGQQATALLVGQSPHYQQERSLDQAAVSSTETGQGTDVYRGAGVQAPHVSSSSGGPAEALSSGKAAAAGAAVVAEEQWQLAGASGSHHVVSPFNQLAQPRELQAPVHQQPSGSLPEEAEGQPQPTRAEFVAAAAAAVAAATAASTVAVPGAPSSGVAPWKANSNRDDGVVPVEPLPLILAPYDAPPSPRSAPPVTTGPTTVAPVGSSIAAVLVQPYDLDDDLLDEAAAGKMKPRRARVGLWGWISGESAR